MSKKIINGQHNGDDFVEIGGIKWATCNVGAEKPTDFGLYFQWGDHKGYAADEVGNVKMFNYYHYKHYNGKRLTKYNKFDKKQVLDLRDDPAFAYMGHGWRMPTDEEFGCLVANTTQRWTRNYQDSCVAGMVFTDITDDSKELFFPAAGFGFNSYVDHVGVYSYYWASSLSSGNVLYSHSFDLSCGGVNRYRISTRYIGFTVRGILTV